MTFVRTSLGSGLAILSNFCSGTFVLGLDIHGVGNGFDGIKFIAGGSLHVEDSVISGMQNGINIGAGNEIYIKNTYIRNNSNVGVYVAGSGGLVNAVIEKTTVENQVYGLAVGTNARVTTRGSVYSGNSSSGISAQGGGSVNVDNCIVTNNAVVGLYSADQGMLRVANSFITGNNIGVSTAGSGIAATFFDNKLQGNTVDGAFNLGLTTN